jgi:hypothetical protein
MHKDPLGNKLIEGDYVAWASHNHLKIGTVYKLTPKMVLVIPTGKQYRDRKYPKDVIKINDSKVSMYMLKYSK